MDDSIDNLKKQQTNRKIIIAVAIVWFVSVLAFLIYVASIKVIDFDKDGKLWRLSQHSNFDNMFAAQIEKTVGKTAVKVIHFTQQHCECNQVAQEHIASVERLAEENGYTNVSVTLTKSSELTSYIPATPAVAAFDANGSLIYLGPYSAGYSCTVGNGLIESFLSKGVTRKVGATVISDTQGCYCEI